MKSSSLGFLAFVLIAACGEIAPTTSSSPEDASASADAGATPPASDAAVLGESTVKFSAPGEHFIAIGGTSDTDIWAVGSRNGMDWVIRHWDGASWTLTPTNAAGHALGVWARAPDDAWVVGTNGVALHWQGTSWTASDTSSFLAPDTGVLVPDCPNTYDGCGYLGETTLWSVFGFAADDIWAGGSVTPSEAGRSLLVHYDGTSWTRVPVDPSAYDVQSLWGSSPTDLWASGLIGTTLHWNGSQWTREDGASYLDRRGMWGTSSEAIWAVGSGGMVTRFDGATWLPVAEDKYAHLTGISGSSANDVWAVGGAAELPERIVGRHVRHWNGTRWSGCSAPGVAQPRSVWVSETGKVWIVGGDIEEISAAARGCTD